MRRLRTEGGTGVTPTQISSSLRNRGNIAVERASDVVDNVELAGERDLAIWSLDKCFEQRRFVETALEHIAGGTYGCCLRYDEEISMKR
jgi:RNA polymerase-binding transcription factor DksA